MAGEIEFTTNYSDLSTDNGFQFEFRCDRCGNGYRTEFDTFELSTATNVLDGASGLLGGFFGQAADVAQRAKSAAWEKASDKAFKKASGGDPAQVRAVPALQRLDVPRAVLEREEGPLQAVRPDLGVEMAAAQADKSVEEVWAHAKMAEEDKHLTEADWREGITASCPSCGAPQATNAKFCAQCGADLKAAKHCTQCGAKLEPGAKFCSGCGSAAG